jgi:1-acyl-sn-glycerol-3-phosphate acyltransferase
VSCLIVPGGALFMKLARLWSWLILRTCRVRLTARYSPSLEASAPAIYMSNHQSLFDIPALILTIPADFRMVPKRELLFVPIFGQSLWLAGFIFVNRRNRAEAIRSLDRAASRVERGTSILIFPEGTRSPDGSLLPFKKGGFALALKAGVPVVPVSLRGGREILPKGSLRIRPGRIETIFGAPIATSAYSLETKEDLLARVRDAIAAGLADPARETAPAPRGAPGPPAPNDAPG